MQLVGLDIITIVSFGVLGIWLQGIGEIRDTFDRFLTPYPLILFGSLLVISERLPALSI